MRFRTHSSGEPLALKLVSAIDMVFLLLIFFMLSFHIKAEEGDLELNLPRTTDGIGEIVDHTIPVTLESNDDGSLKQLSLGERQLGNSTPACFDDLNTLMGMLVAESADPDQLSVEIRADYSLSYRHIVSAISACRGKNINGKQIEFVQRIKFAPSVSPVSHP